MWHHGILHPNTMSLLLLLENPHLHAALLCIPQDPSKHLLSVKSFLNSPDEVRRLVIPSYVTTLNPISFLI